MKSKIVFAIAALCATSSFADITVSVDANAGVKKISPYIYGRNIDVLVDTSSKITESEQDFINKTLEAGIHMMRANTGNNATRYNWRKKLTVHPDWYNNVNPHDWDITAQKIQKNLPGVDAMYAFQLTGYAAKTNAYNFADWDFYINHNKTWATATLNLAGGGEVAEDGKTLVKAGDYSLYNEAWPADSTVGIIDHWKTDLKYDMSRFKYWSMDNEMEIWANTHSDLPLDLTGDFLVERYIDVALKAREAWPDVKLTGPVAANEWYWCSISYGDGKSGRIKKDATGESRDYCWLEYFIKKVAEAQKTTGKRLIDVFDIHWYPEEKTYEDQVNWHRVFFDTNYVYPGANSIKQVNGGWDESIKKEFIFKRINDWLDKYFGEGHGITLALTETTLGKTDDAMTTALIYASWLGTFMDNGVEIFTPWTWHPGMYETVHLFSRYGHKNRIASVSSNDSIVSAYSSITDKQDSMTVILVNRSEKESQKISLDITDFKLQDGNAYTLSLSKLNGETFESHAVNALQQGFATVADNKVSLEVPAKSITAVILANVEATALPQTAVKPNTKLYNINKELFLDNSKGNITSVVLLNSLGQKIAFWNAPTKGQVKLSSKAISRGTYIANIHTAQGVESQKIFIP